MGVNNKNQLYLRIKMKDLHEIWPHRWMTPKAESFKSKIHGFGVRTKKPISKDEVIIVVGGIIVPSKEILKYRKKMGHIGLQIDDGFFICPTNMKEIENIGAPNHSCEPNAGIKDTIKYVAIKDIEIGEEIVMDYAFFESNFKPFKCNCGSKNCRKIIRPTDWKSKEIQKNIKNVFHNI